MATLSGQHGLTTKYANKDLGGKSQMAATSIEPTTHTVEVSPSGPQTVPALAVIGIAQLMIVLDASVVTIALPSAQRALHISVANRQWALTAYTLAFGGLLLLGGRVADFMGRKRMFIISLLGFAAASALGGLAQNSAMLFGARALQGAFAAIMAPASLSLLTVTFTEPKERARAFGVYGAIAGGGAAIGLVLGGLLTEYASWRWTLLINVPIAILAALAATRLVHESKAEGESRYDIPGALTSTLGLLSLVYGFTRAETDGWASPITLSLLIVGIGLLVAFVLIEQRSGSRCCRCGWSSTATGAARSWLHSWSGSPCSAPSCSSRTTCRLCWVTRP